VQPTPTANRNSFFKGGSTRRNNLPSMWT